MAGLARRRGCTAGRHKVMAPRARLLRRVDDWDVACAQRFADACAGRARDHAAAALDRADAAGSRGVLRDELATPREVREAVRDAEPPEVARIAVTRWRVTPPSGRSAGAAVVTAYIAAHTAARGGTRRTPFAVERDWQSDWLALAELALGS